MKILYASPRQCWPATGGAKLRDYHLARALGDWGAVTYVYYSNPDLPSATNALREFCADVVAVPAPPRYDPVKLAQGLLGRWPLPVLNYTSPGMVQALGSLLRNRFDLIHFDGIHLAGCAAAIRNLIGDTPVFYDWHNIESEAMERYAANASGLKRFYARPTARRLAGLESRVLREASGHIVCSPRESEALRQRDARARLAVIENGVDTRRIQPAGRDFTAKTRLVYVGAMDYHANVDAVTTFARGIWPAIRQEFPRFHFTIVGSNPVPEVLALAREPGIEVTGTVPDPAAYYEDSFASLVPLRIGAGTRLKILEAMSAGVPVISTRLGAEGLSVTPSRDILIAGQQTEWIAALRHLTVSPEDRSSLIRHARTLVEQQYDWQLLGKQLVQVYSGWIK